MGLRYDEPVSGPPVATDRDAADDNFQVVKVAFGSGGSPAEAQRVERGVPLPARDYHGGSTAFDSGRQVVALGAPASIGVDVDSWLDSVFFVNLTGAVQRVSVTDGSGASYGDQVLQPNEWRPVPLGGIKFEQGFMIGAENAASVVVQVKGTQ